MRSGKSFGLRYIFGKIMSTVENPKNPGQIFGIFSRIFAIFLLILMSKIYWNFQKFQYIFGIFHICINIYIFDYFGSFGFGFAKVSTAESVYNFRSSFDRRNTSKP